MKKSHLIAWLIVALIVCIGVIYSIEVDIEDPECFSRIAKEVCKDNELKYIGSYFSLDSSIYFRCQDVINEKQRVSFDNSIPFSFTDEEIKKCTTKRGIR